MDDIVLSGRDVAEAHYDLRGIKVACSGGTDKLRRMLEAVPDGLGCYLVLELTDGDEDEDEVPEGMPAELKVGALDAEDEAHREYPGDPAAAIDSLERFADEWRRKEAEGCQSR